MSQFVIYEANKMERHYWRDIWSYRSLFIFLAWRDILVRYKQTSIGIAWAILQPMLMMLVFSIIFGKIANLPSHDIPYSLIVLAGLIPWQFFALGFSEAGNSLIANSAMISKVYFPRIIIPLSSIIVCLVDLIISGILFILLMLWYGFFPSWHIIFLPLFIILAVLAIFGAGLWVAALNVRYRDFRYIIPFTVQIGMYLSPVGYLSNLVPTSWRLLYALNPMVGIIDGFRFCLLGAKMDLYWPEVAISITVILSILITGMYYFRHTEKTFADVI